MVFRKLLIALPLFVICSVSQGQVKSTVLNENISYSIEISPNKPPKNIQYTLILRIDNQSDDTVYIKNFNQYIFHKSDYSKERKTFSWEILTTSNQVPEDVVIVIGMGFTSKKKKMGKDVNIIIPPNSTFVSDIYILYSSFIRYGEGTYKLCLYYGTIDKCIAEVIVER